MTPDPRAVQFVSSCETCPIGLERREKEKSQTTEAIALVALLLGGFALLAFFVFAGRVDRRLELICGAPL